MSSLRERVEGLVAKLKPLLEKATPRPWLIKPTRIGKLVWEQRNPHGEASSWVSMIRADDPENANFAIVCELDFGYGRKTQEADAELIVAAVNAISELAAALAAEGSQAPIQELEKLRQSWDELADRLDRQYSFDFRCGVQRCEAELGLLIKALTAEAAAPSLHKEGAGGELCECGQPKNSIRHSFTAATSVDAHEFKPKLRYCGRCNQRRYFVDGKCEMCAASPAGRAEHK